MGVSPYPVTGKTVIYYANREPKRAKNLAECQISAQESKKRGDIRRPRSSSITIASTTALSNDLPGTTSVAPQTNPHGFSIPSIQGSESSDNLPPSPIMRPDSPSNLRQHAGASAQILLRLLKDACDIFHQVPYVKVVAGLVQEIIKISEVCVAFGIVSELEANEISGSRRQQRQYHSFHPENLNFFSSRIRRTNGLSQSWSLFSRVIQYRRRSVGPRNVRS